MKFLVVFALCFAAALAAPAPPADEVQILKSEFENIGIDGYKFAYEQSDGQAREESAVVNNLGTENESLSVKGFYTFIGDDGQTYRVDYIADENGFQPSAPHIPSA